MHGVISKIIIAYKIIGKTEGLTEKLRSILAQFEYQHCISQWAERGVDFKTYLYVAEVHPETDEVFYEREDEAHVLKVCKTLYINTGISTILYFYRELLSIHVLVAHLNSI